MIGDESTYLGSGVSSCAAIVPPQRTANGDFGGDTIANHYWHEAAETIVDWKDDAWHFDWSPLSSGGNLPFPCQSIGWLTTFLLCV